jgi:hypothetical protein
MAGVIDSPLGVLTIATTHLSFVPGWNVHQLRRLRRDLTPLPRSAATALSRIGR